MSVRMSISNNKVNKPYCKVCHDAGKKEEEYTSHYVKSTPGPNGIVVCPTLLAQECKFCFKKGHTTSYCKQLSMKNDIENRNQNVICKEVVKPIIKIKHDNKFSILSNEDDDFVAEEKKDVEEFPALVTVTRTNLSKKNVSISYASIAAKAPEAEIQQKKKLPPLKIPELIKNRKWSEYSDSEDEEEEDDISVIYPSPDSFDYRETW
jgi:hypothetical protein